MHGKAEMLAVFKPKEGSHTCHLCDFKGTEKKHLKQHIKRMHGKSEIEKVFKKPECQNCHLCEFKSHTKAEVKRHIGGEHGENELKAYKLRDIKAWKERSEAWKERSEDKKTKEVESKVCPFCAGTFRYLEQHIMYKHESEKPWKCDKCDFAHATKIGLKVKTFQ